MMIVSHSKVCLLGAFPLFGEFSDRILWCTGPSLALWVLASNRCLEARCELSGPLCANEGVAKDGYPILHYS